tara:strand:- start:337 stop:606 length:270 start_codon:yes stop_codon:yes gene_type:complete
MAKRGRPKRKHPLTKAEKIERKARYTANRRAARKVRREKLDAEIQEWEEIGWIVEKMSNEANMSQDLIYETLGGMYTKKRILYWSKKNR